MQDSSTGPGSVLQFRQDLQTKLRDGVRRAIETVLEEELLAALGADAHERTAGRRGYPHGTIERTVTTREGTRVLTVPRGRVRGPSGRQEEFHSTVMPRYARRTREVDEALLGCYFGGVNSRRIRRALKPLFGEAHLSKSAVSRVVARVKAQFLTWQQRPLTEERYAVVFLDGFHLRVRLAGRVITVPVLAALGLTETGQKQLVALQLATTEATTSWGGRLGDLQRRGLPAPLLVVTDGHAGLKKALEAWPTVRVQRCTTHIAGRDPRLPRGEMSPPGQVPMRPVVWGQTWRGNWSRRSRPDNVASVPSPEALTKSRAATKVNAFGAVNASWTSIAGRVQDQGGRVACAPTKTVTTVETWGSEAVVPSAFKAAAREEGDVRERTRAHRVGSGSAVVSVDIKRDPLKFRATPGGQSEEAIVAKKAWTAKPAGAKGLYLSQAS